MRIEKCRAQIDIVDDELLLLLNKRVNLVADIMIEKRRLKLGRRDRQRARARGGERGPGRAPPLSTGRADSRGRYLTAR